LNLAARHPETLRMLVAHEPPVMVLLADAAVHRANAQDVYDTYKKEGAGAAMQKFLALAGLRNGPPPDALSHKPTPGMLESMARMGRNIELFLVHGIRQTGSFVPDIAMLRTGSPRIVVAGGEASGNQPAYRAAVALAERLGTKTVPFPGDHGGFTTHPQQFAATLHEVFTRD
jgi:hypothetical protein